jgi:hypothetical protein
MPNLTPACPNAPDSDLHWVKSSFSFANGDCVEVASLPGGRIGVRDSKDTLGPVLRFTSAEWNAFIGSLRSLRTARGWRREFRGPRHPRLPPA